MSYIVRNLRTRPTHRPTYWVNIRGLFNPTYIDNVNKLKTNNLLLNSQNKSDIDETFTEPSDGYCFKSNYIKPNQLLIFSKPSDGHCLKSDQTKPYQTKPNHTIPNQL